MSKKWSTVLITITLLWSTPKIKDLWSFVVSAHTSFFFFPFGMWKTYNVNICRRKSVMLFWRNDTTFEMMTFLIVIKQIMNITTNIAMCNKVLCPAWWIASTKKFNQRSFLMQSKTIKVLSCRRGGRMQQFALTVYRNKTLPSRQEMSWMY